MTLIKKIDVMNHLASRNRKGSPLFRSKSQPDATGFSGDETTHKDFRPKSSLGEGKTQLPAVELKISAIEATPSPADSLKQIAFRSAQS